MERKLIVRNFWREGLFEDRDLWEDELGWSDSSKRDAMSDYPEAVFRYFVEIVGLNILFYWVDDNCFYTIETELDPVEVRRIYPNPRWDGSCTYASAGIDYGPSTCSKGEIIATFADETAIWDNLRIRGIPIGEVLERSAILTLD